MKLLRRAGVVIVASLVLLGVIAAGGYWYTHETADGRILYKRLKAPSPYTFDEIPESMRNTDPAKLIADLTAPDLPVLRQDLNQVFWGTVKLPDRLPHSVDSGKEPSALAQFAHLVKLERLVVPFEFGYTAYAYLMHPADPNGRAVIYHHGYAGTIVQSRHVIEALLQQGFTVAALDYAGYGQNIIGNLEHPSFGVVSVENDRQMYFAVHPLRWYLEPMVVTVNYLIMQGFTELSSVGFSAGGWVTTMVGAVDSRIATTIAVASGYPIYIRQQNWAKETPLPQLYKPLLDTVSYLDTYVLAANGADRQYVQIFNQYDRCCYRNRFSELYAGAVTEAVSRLGQGRFEALIDQTHAEHKVSGWAVDAILATLAN